MRHPNLFVLQHSYCLLAARSRCLIRPIDVPVEGVMQFDGCTLVGVATLI